MHSLYFYFLKKALRALTDTIYNFTLQYNTWNLISITVNVRQDNSLVKLIFNFLPVLIAQKSGFAQKVK